MPRVLLLCLLAPLGALVTLPARAQEIPEVGVDAKEVLAERTDLAEGWSYRLKLAANGSFSHSSNVVGTLDGATVQFGALIDADLNYLTGNHRWENSLAVKHGQTLTPQFEAFIKSSDQLAVESTYNYILPWVPWLGPFARVGLDTALLPGYEVQAEELTVLRNRNDATVDSEIASAGTNIELTGPFEPLVLEQSTGFFANPISVGRLTFIARVGFGFREIVTQGGFTKADDDATPELELDQLSDSQEGGAVVEVEAYGGFRDLVTWELKTKTLFPFFTNAETELSGADLISTEFTAKLSLIVAKWFSVDYQFLVKRLPLVLDEWQIQNGIYATASFEMK